MFGTVDTGNGSDSQVCPRAIGGITTCHKIIHTCSLSLATVTDISFCMRELLLFHHGPTSSFLYSRPIQTPPSGQGLICATGHVFIWDDPSVTPLSRYFHSSIHNIYVVRASCFEMQSASVESRKQFLDGSLCLTGCWPWSGCLGSSSWRQRSA